MQKGRRKGEYCLWIEKEKRIISFHRVEGFELLVFDNRSVMMSYALNLALSGYRVQ